ncbi:DUF2497 domain-containing protein [Novosphingobium sp. FSY-8]|uniref:DUF2497 domain-containing protein n=2 Tax=Novosphingobium ovatum TaxID=1908523 RepID=A0ABW9XHG0_9SPHN|nr:DUF2497 domain-containing protein [Novosphingobium ovatum]
MPHDNMQAGSTHHAGPSNDDILDLGVSGQFLDPQDEPLVLTHEEEVALVNAEARASMRDSLATLAAVAHPDPAPAPAPAPKGDTSLEEMVRELLRPALSDWLDKNLPAMVERMVQEEIARIVGKQD